MELSLCHRMVEESSDMKALVPHVCAFLDDGRGAASGDGPMRDAMYQLRN